MILDEKPFEQLTAEDILAMIPDVAEGRRLDYKEALPQEGEKGVRSFLCDVTALANSAGGFLIYGVAEARDEDNNQTGVPERVVGVAAEVVEDQAIQAWQQRINQTIEPRIIGHRVGFVSGFEDGQRVMVVYVPKSLLAPHRVTYKGTRDFYVRHDRNNELMDINEIRASFVDFASLPERLNEFRAVRVSKVLADETPAPLTGGWTVALHAIPLGSLNGESAVDIHTLAAGIHQLDLIDASASRRTFNLDGLLYTSSSEPGYDSGYLQVFRNGTLELVRSVPHMSQNGENGTLVVASEWLEEHLQKTTQAMMALLVQAGVRPPVYFGLSVLRTKGFAMARKNRQNFFREGDKRFDRDTVMLPFVVSETLEEDAATLLRPAVDVMWQASGLPQSDFYDADGNWTK